MSSKCIFLSGNSISIPIQIKIIIMHHHKPIYLYGTTTGEHDLSGILLGIMQPIL